MKNQVLPEAALILLNTADLNWHVDNLLVVGSGNNLGGRKQKEFTAAMTGYYLAKLMCRYEGKLQGYAGRYSRGEDYWLGDVQPKIKVLGSPGWDLPWSSQLDTVKRFMFCKDI